MKVSGHIVCSERKMKKIIEYDKYDSCEGLRLNWERNFSINVKQEDGQGIISANREGLLSLANHLANMAQTDVPSGVPIHLDENNSLEDGSRELILEKID